MKKLFPLFLLIMTNAWAESDAQYQKNCQYLKSITKLNMALTADNLVDDNIKQLRLAQKTLCGLPRANNATVNYTNGQTATNSYGNGGYNWYYANGKTITSGSSYSTWYYPNGQQIASSQDAGYTVTYPNGKNATTLWMKSNATWYYPNGQIITYSAGSKGSTWYYANGKTISSSMGNAGATWYNVDGSTLTNQGPELTEEQLINVPLILSKILAEDIE